MVTAGPIVSVEAAPGLLGGRGACSLHQRRLYWACQISEKNLRAENSLQTGLHGWPRAVRRPWNRAVWEDMRSQAWASPCIRSGCPRLLNCVHLDEPPVGIFRMGFWCRTGRSTIMFRYKWSAQFVRGFVSAWTGEVTVAGMWDPASGPVLWLCPVWSVRTLNDSTSQSNSFFIRKLGCWSSSKGLIPRE